jgi:hypothetical protein
MVREHWVERGSSQKGVTNNAEIGEFLYVTGFPEGVISR